jgi:hypothetical protein
LAKLTDILHLDAQKKKKKKTWKLTDFPLIHTKFDPNTIPLPIHDIITLSTPIAYHTTHTRIQTYFIFPKHDKPIHSLKVPKVRAT